MPSLRKNFAWTVLGRLVYGVCQWGVLILIARLGSAEQVGEFGLGLAICAPVYQFLNLGLRAIRATDVRLGFSFGTYWNLRIASNIVAIAIIAAIGFAAGYRHTMLLILMILAVAKAIEATSDVFFGEIQRVERMDVLAYSLFINGPLTLVGLGVLMSMGVDWPYPLFALIGIWLGVLLLFDVPQTRMAISAQSNNGGTLDWSYSWDSIHKLLRLAWPLGIFATLTSLSTSIPRYALETFADSRTVGYFTAISYVIVIGMAFATPLQQAASPRLAHYYAESRTEFIRLFFRLLLFGGAMGIVGVIVSELWGEEILSLVYGNDYGKYSQELVVLMLGGCAMYLQAFVNAGLTIMRALWSQSVTAGVVAFSTLLCALVFVPRYGLFGAAISVSISLWLGLFAALVLFWVRWRKLDAMNPQDNHSVL